MIALTEERKRQIIDEEADGLWLVVDEEYPRDVTTPGDLLCGDLDAGTTLPAPASSAGLADAFSAKDRD